MSRLPLVLIVALLALLVPQGARAQRPKPPHDVFFRADDLGWKNVGYHGGEATPNIDRLAKEGVRLEQFYVMPVCTPTRAALLTGRYPMRYGLQSGVNRPWSQWGLPLEERLLPQELKAAGYRTAIVGKWHLGHPRPEYLPTRRGFDHQYGHYTGAIDYFDHGRLGGHDWHRDDKANRDEGYTTELIEKEGVRLIQDHDPARPLFLYVAFNAPHSPLQAPQEYIDRFGHIRQPRKRAYAAMVARMDEAIGRITAALDERGMGRDTLVVFSSDNGGPLGFAADNGDLRAGKGTLYEGGVRVPAFARWPGRLTPGEVKTPVHMVDWYPTLLRLAGAKLEQPLPVDGRDIWPVLAEGTPSPHADILLNAEPNHGALRSGDWKLVVSGINPATGEPVNAARAEVELFNVVQDPLERTNLAEGEPAKRDELRERLKRYAQQAVPPKGGDARDPQPPDWKAPAVFGEQ
jgi:arylsulfatase A-like enzyme